MSSNPQEIVVGNLSFSAGSNGINIEKASLVTPDNTLHESILRIFPELRTLVSGSPPVLANLYPAYFGSARFALNVECMMRPINAIKAMALAKHRGSPFILCGQPLPIAQFAHLVRESRQKPHVVVLLLGGYECPASLEQYIVTALAPCEEVHVLHGYGSIESAFSILVGKRSGGRDVLYRVAKPDWAVVQTPTGPAFRNINTESAVAIEDKILPVKGGFIITPSAARLDTQKRKFFNSRDDNWWERHTGHIRSANLNGHYHVQLRPGVLPASPLEHRFGEFIDCWGMDWADKPEWG